MMKFERRQRLLSATRYEKVFEWMGNVMYTSFFWQRTSFCVVKWTDWVFNGFLIKFDHSQKMSQPSIP